MLHIFIVILQTPRSILFPYTTLFRSCGKRAERQISLGGGLVFRGSGFYTTEGEDRKSTRLNSSHEWISYAVFCLKKKKQWKHRKRADGIHRDSDANGGRRRYRRTTQN